MPTFDIGLVMAGAVSAGAYTAGTVDFLLQALDEWYTAKSRGDANVPPHDVRLKVIAGASAGGITAAIVAAVLGEELPPVDDYPAQSQGAANKLFDAWVNLVDIRELLGHVDLDADPGPVRSLLDSTVLDRIGVRVFRPGTRRATNRPYIADPLLAAVTVTNLRGVPYKIDFAGLMGQAIPYAMTLHADAVTVRIGRPTVAMVTGQAGGVDDPDKVPLLNPDEIGTGRWLDFRDAALASGAFPIGLVPRALGRPAGDYRQRRWYFPHPRNDNGVHECGRFGMLDPFWKQPNESRYDYLCVDGGVMDNEPVGLARALLTPNDMTGMQSAGADTLGALMMIDPFPDSAAFDANDTLHSDFTLFKLVPSLFRSLINQARFKPAELTRAMAPDVFNQFLLAPVRYDDAMQAINAPVIACGGLGGFAGFLSRDFRAHDFQLGRLNAQRFLRRHFVLPETLSGGEVNPLFADWSDAAREKHRIRKDATGRILERDEAVASTNYLPVVPLLGRAAEDEPNPTWPSYPRSDLRELTRQASDRATQVVDRLVQKIDGWGTRRLLNNAWWLKRSDVIDRQVRQRVESDLTERGLLRT